MNTAGVTADEARHRLYEIMKGPDSFEEKAREALQVGTAYLDVETGFITRVERETDHWETIISTDGTDGQVPEGMKRKLSGTYCRHTLERDSPLALHDIPNQKFETDVDGFDCYHGTTLTIGEKPYGTVCFVSQRARSDPFSEAETMFAELVSRLLEHELEHERQQEQLARQTSLVNVLDRVLRHNIRNKLTVIRANARLNGDRHGSCPECGKIVDAADELIEMSETARELGKSINADSERRPIDVAAVLADIEKRLGQRYPETVVTVDTPEKLVLPAFPNLENALWELAENAATHAGEQPQVQMAVREAADVVKIEVEDDGPGLPETEQDVLQTGMETPLVHGSGLGLWSVYWAVTDHRGSIEIDTDDGTKITLSLPRIGGTDSSPRVSRANDRYEAAFEDAPYGVVVLDTEGYLTEVNKHAAVLFDRTPSAIVGQHFSEVIDSATGPFDEGRLTAGDGDCTVTANGEIHRLSYTVTTDILPGQHLAVFESQC